MKKLIFLIILIVVCYIAYDKHTEKEEEKVNNDLKIIQQVDEACQKVAVSREVFSLGNAGTIHIFDLELIYQNDGECYEALVSLLGEDFQTVLSNGDRLFVGFFPHRQKYYIYAGNPRDDACMIAPDWNYAKVLPKTE